MSVAEKILLLKEDFDNVFAAGEGKHTSRYSVTLAVGDGTNSVTFSVPFEPDCIFVTTHGADATASDNSVLQMVFDKRAFARYGGMYRVRRDGANTQGAMASATGGNYFRWADGVCTVEAPSSLGVNYTSGAQYVCTAVKYTDKSDKDLLSEEIQSLADSGETLSYSQKRINETVTDAEWQTLIALKPNRTFTLS